MLKLTEELEQAVHAQNGGPLRVTGEIESYVVMSTDAYCELTGVTDDADLNASVTALQQAMREVQAGRSRPLREFLDELGRQYEVPS